MHTKGPWKWWDKSTGRPVNHDLARLLGANGYNIFTTYGGSGNRAIGDSATDKANARLIAAAPELLEALEEIKEMAKEGYCDCEVGPGLHAVSCPTAILTVAQNAIKKAKA